MRDGQGVWCLPVRPASVCCGRVSRKRASIDDYVTQTLLAEITSGLLASEVETIRVGLDTVETETTTTDLSLYELRLGSRSGS